MIAALFALIEVVFSIIFDAAKKFVGLVLVTALVACALFFTAIVTLTYMLI